MIEEIIINKIDEVNEEYNIIVKNSPDNGYKLNDINILAHQKEAMNKVLNELLIEIKNQPDYKSAFEKLNGFLNKRYAEEYITNDYENAILDIKEEIKQYNLGGE